MADASIARADPTPRLGAAPQSRVRPAMEAMFYPVLLGSVLVMLSILAGTLSTRIGAPLLLVFLALGMLAGEDGIGGIVFEDFRSTYLVGSIALAVILFDGGLRTPRSSFALAMWPALSLATLGIVLTAVFAAVFAAFFLGMSPL